MEHEPATVITVTLDADGNHRDTALTDGVRSTTLGRLP
jgi:hypothetical protein